MSLRDFLNWLFGNSNPKPTPVPLPQPVPVPKPTPILSGPTGYYVTPPKINSAKDALPESYFQAPKMDGVAIRLQWDAFEPTEHQYNWSLLEGMVKNAVKYNKKFSIALVGASQSPDWVKVGANRLTFQVESPMLKTLTFPTPWSSYYRSTYSNAFLSIREQLAGWGAFGNLSLVQFGHQSTDSAELNAPRSEDLAINALTVWQTAGYTSDKMINAYLGIVSDVATLFPGVALGQVVMDGRSFPRLGLNGEIVRRDAVDTADQIIDRLALSYGPRFYAIGNGLCHNLGATPMSARLAYAKSKGLSTGWQTTHSGSDDILRASCAADDRINAVKCSASDYMKAMTRAFNEGTSFVQVWPADFDEFLR